MKNIFMNLAILCGMMLTGSQLTAQSVTKSGLLRKNFQTEIDGKYTDLFVLKNKNGMEACITNYGGRVVSLMVPDRNGKLEDVVTGFPTIQEYATIRQNYGSAVGRYIGRIQGASFTLDGVTYQLDGKPHCTHGGKPGFANRVWNPRQEDARTLHLYYTSPDGESGFPGTLSVHLTYKLRDDNALDITYEATTDKPTVLNLSHHSFFNITGDLNRSIETTYMQVDGDYLVEYDATKCVTGNLMPVKGTPFDFKELKLIGKDINADDAQLKVTAGYDHCWVVNTNGDDRKAAVHQVDSVSGRTLDVYTTEPGVHVYTANGLDGKTIGKNEVAYPRRGAVCFETMHFADSPNKPQFPSTVLRPGQTYYTHTVYKFGRLKK